MAVEDGDPLLLYYHERQHPLSAPSTSLSGVASPPPEIATSLTVPHHHHHHHEQLQPPLYHQTNENNCAGAACFG